MNRSRRSSSLTIALILTCVLSLVGIDSARSFPVEWLAVPTDGDWNNGLNWDTGVAPNSSVADVEFLGSSITSINPLSASFAVRGALFSGPDSFTIGPGFIFQWRAGGITVAPGVPGQTISMQTRPLNSSPIINNGTGLLSFPSGEMLTTSSSTTPMVLTFGGTGGDILVSKVTRRLSPGLVNIIKEGTNKLTIPDARTVVEVSEVGPITGTTTITGGMISIDHEDNLGFGPVAFDPAGLLLSGGALEATATFAIDEANRGVQLGAGGGTFAVTAANVLTISNPIVGIGSLTKTDTGTLILNGTSSHTGGTVVSDGTLTLEGNLIDGTVDISGGGLMNGTGEIDFSLGELITVTGILDATSLQFNLTGLSTNDVGIVLVDYSAGTFNSPANVNDLLTPASLGANWGLLDTGSLIITTLVPEPSSLLLLALGTVGLVNGRRKRRVRV